MDSKIINIKYGDLMNSFNCDLVDLYEVFIFMDDKNTGVKYIGVNKPGWDGRFLITDESKWLFTKLKYGL